MNALSKKNYVETLRLNETNKEYVILKIDKQVKYPSLINYIVIFVYLYFAFYFFLSAFFMLNPSNQISFVVSNTFCKVITSILRNLMFYTFINNLNPSYYD